MTARRRTARRTARRTVVTAFVFLLGGPPAAGAAPLGLDADECAVQRALLGRAAPDCPPLPEPPAAAAIPPPVVADPVPSAKAPAAAPPPPPVAPPPTAAAPAATPPPPPPSVARAADFLILFDFASARLSPASEALLRRIAAVMNAPAAAEARFRIVGHTDGVGSPAANLALSKRRADAVAAWLTAKGGVATARLETAGLGLTRLAEPGNPAAAANRRVEIVTLPR